MAEVIELQKLKVGATLNMNLAHFEGKLGSKYRVVVAMGDGSWRAV